MTTSPVGQPTITRRRQTVADHQDFPVRRFIASAIGFFIVAAVGVSFATIQVIEPHRGDIGNARDAVIAWWDKENAETRVFVDTKLGQAMINPLIRGFFE
jgi:hypothetical protein